jgi:two-component system, response regulator
MTEHQTAADILLVEDNEHDAEMALRALTRRISNHVDWVKDGAEAIDFIFRRGAHAARTGPLPRLVLLDLKMPKIDGVGVLRALKADETTRNIPVVMLTSSAEERDVVETYRLGVNSYIVKPVDFTQFSDTVAEAGLYWMITNRTPG